MPSSGSTRSKVARGPPAKIEMLPVAARWQPPDTGQSMAKAPCCCTRAARRRASAWSVVLISSQILPGARPASTPSAASMTAAHTAGEGRQVMMMSTCGGQLRRRGGRLGAARDECGHPLRIQVPHRKIDAMREQIARQLGADVTESDETDPQVRHVSSDSRPARGAVTSGPQPRRFLQAWLRAAWLRRQAAGGAPNSRRKARLKALSVW